MREKGLAVIDLPTRLNDGLLPGAQKSYDRLSQQEQSQYEHALHKVIRMEGIRELGFVPSDFQESDLQHVSECIKIAREYYESSPELAKEVNFTLVQKMLLLHDVGEIHPAIGDVKPTDRTTQEERRKRLEPFAGRLMLDRISDPAARREAVRLYGRYEANNPFDVTVQMARFIDKAQGTSRVADIVFSSEIGKSKGNLKKMKDHLSVTGYRMLGPAVNLLSALKTPSARQEAKALVMGEYDRIAKAGHPDIAGTYKPYIAQIA